MTDLEKAANEAAEALKGCEKSRTGIVISEIADSYGMDRSALGRELWRRSQNTKKEKEQMSKKEVGRNMPLNYLRIEQLVKERGFTINDFAEVCGKSRGYFDDVREGRTKAVRAKTYTEFARKLGVPVEAIILTDEKQMSLFPPKEKEEIRQEKTSVDYLNEEERKIMKILAACSGMTEEEIEHYAVKRFIEMMGVVPLKEIKLGGGK